MTSKSIILLGLLALPAMAADIEMESATEPDTGVDLPEVEVREPNIDRQVGSEEGIRRPSVPQADLAPPRTGLGDSGTDAAERDRPSVRGGTMQPESQVGRQPERDARTPSATQRTPATGAPPRNPDIRRPSTTIRAPAGE